MAANDSSLGTRFLLYPQSPNTPGYDKPELVWISDPQGSILPGPQNDRMYVVDPLQSKEPYRYPYLPPFAGETHPPAEPSPDGHWDHIDPSSRAFLGVHVFGCVARVIDVWEGYLGHQFVWHFADRYERLEILPLIDWANAQSGYGMLEFGYNPSPESNKIDLYALNFDVIAHEMGHSMLFTELGVPVDLSRPGPDWMAYHEVVADLCSLFGMMHFDTALDRILRRGSGNLMALNELNRVAELADERQIRIAGNGRKMSEVSEEIHDKSRPFTGGIFDTMVQAYHDAAVAQGLVDVPRGSVPESRDFSTDVAEHYAAAFEADYELKHFQLKEALESARDKIARALAQSWASLDCESMTYADAAFALCDTLQSQNEGDLAETANECLAWREILSPYDTFGLGSDRARSAIWY